MVRQASKPLNGIIPLNREAAECLAEYLETTEPDAQAQMRRLYEDTQSIAQTVAKLGGPRHLTARPSGRALAH